MTDGGAMMATAHGIIDMAGVLPGARSATWRIVLMLARHEAVLICATLSALHRLIE